MYRMNYKLALLGNHFFDIIKDYSICDGSFYSLVKIFDIDEISEGKEKKSFATSRTYQSKNFIYRALK